MNTATLILTSSVISALLSAIISALISIKLKQSDYRNEYYKKILDKRLSAYQFIETQIALLKTTVLDEDDGKAYHAIFAYEEEDLFKFQQNLRTAMAYSIWIDEKTVKTMEELNEMFYHIDLKTGASKNQLSIIGKDYYHRIAELRKRLEVDVKNDLFSLHNLEKFFKAKRNENARIIMIEK